MKRKVIELGHDCMVVTLPRKWVKHNNIKKGDEINIEEEENILQFSTNSIKIITEITLTITDTTESGLRTVLVNAYRAGYDKIIINYEGEKETIVPIIERYMLGFELFTVSKQKYVAENVAEPNIEDFDKILLKQFQILNEIISGLERNIDEDVYRIRKYDNFLKRCLNKNHSHIKEKGFVWQFLSSIVHIANECLNFKKQLKKNLRFKEVEQDMLKEIDDMLKILEKGYLKKDSNILMELHNLEKKKLFEKLTKYLEKNPVVGHHLLVIARMILLATSPLTGMIQSKELSSK